jgi:hypothetical protein
MKIRRVANSPALSINGHREVVTILLPNGNRSRIQVYNLSGTLEEANELLQARDGSTADWDRNLEPRRPIGFEVGVAHEEIRQHSATRKAGALE